MLKDTMSHLRKCEHPVNEGDRHTYDFVSTFLRLEGDVGDIKHPIKEWDLLVVKERRLNVVFSLVPGVAGEVALDIRERCPADGVSEAHYAAVSLWAGSVFVCDM